MALIVTGYFAWRQWKTAHEQWKVAQQRIVLDLFDKRMEVFESLRSAVSKVNSSGKTTQETVQEFANAKNRVLLLFGPDVQDYVEKLYRALLKHCEQTTMMERPPGDIMYPAPGDEEKRHALIRANTESFAEITKFYSEFPALIADYVHMHIKLP